MHEENQTARVGKVVQAGDGQIIYLPASLAAIFLAGELPAGASESEVE